VGYGRRNRPPNDDEDLDKARLGKIMLFLRIGLRVIVGTARHQRQKKRGKHLLIMRALNRGGKNSIGLEKQKKEYCMMSWLQKEIANINDLGGQKKEKSSYRRRKMPGPGAESFRAKG